MKSSPIASQIRAATLSENHDRPETSFRSVSRESRARFITPAALSRCSRSHFRITATNAGPSGCK